MCLACRGVVSGYADGTFRPNNPTTRRELVKMIAVAAGFAQSAPIENAKGSLGGETPL